MANKPRRTKVSEGRTVAERCPKGRSRLKRDIIPGLTAYLLMVGMRYQHAADAMKRIPGYRTDPTAAGSRRAALQAVAAIEAIANRLYETFDSKEWDACVQVVCSAMARPGEQATGENFTDLG